MATAQFDRSSGILLHPTSLPNSGGIGTLGKEAYDFIDFLVTAKQSLWQICPLGPTGYGDSPYQCFSAYAGNPYLIDLEELRKQGLLTSLELEPLKKLPTNFVDFGALIPLKMNILLKAYGRFLGIFRKSDTACRVKKAQFEHFQKKEAYWLDDYSLFMVLKDQFGGESWDKWPQEYRTRDVSTLEGVRKEKTREIGFHEFLQFIFFGQWRALRNYANTHGVKIIGDMPIFIAYDSADSWSRPEVFLFDSQGRPTHVAGVPPDYFSATGQLWGNPLYNWDYLEKTGFRWWIDVLKNKLTFYDYLRIDHFRGFSAYWKITYGETTAINGEWVTAPGKKLFAAVKGELGNPPIIAEDLGVITPDVKELIEYCDFPGMKILQFAFDSGEDNDHLPHTAVPNSLMYTGTHDNNTIHGWFAQAPEQDKEMARRYLKIQRTSNLHWDFVQGVMASVSVFAITPVQDLLGLGPEARFNFPGTLGKNWTWRMKKSALTANLGRRLADLTELYGRF
ncbi:MAG: 4-alpha-glucanotransferase [Spirochaetales bacterium]|nr:4-alpha-glucanotransferase [Spirochaetales bacterium]